MSANAQQLQRKDPPPPKPQERVSIREVEIEKIKRQLHHLIDRVDALKQGEAK